MDKPIYTRRLDLINSLPWGAQKRMAEIVDITATTISRVLNGKLNAATDTNKWVIILAEQMVKRFKLINNMENQKQYDILELQKMSIIELTSIADQVHIEIQNDMKQGLIYAIIDNQYAQRRGEPVCSPSELNARDRYAVAESITTAKTA